MVNVCVSAWRRNIIIIYLSRVVLAATSPCVISKHNPIPIKRRLQTINVCVYLCTYCVIIYLYMLVYNILLCRVYIYVFICIYIFLFGFSVSRICVFDSVMCILLCVCIFVRVNVTDFANGMPRRWTMTSAVAAPTLVFLHPTSRPRFVRRSPSSAFTLDRRRRAARSRRRRSAACGRDRRQS